MSTKRRQKVLRDNILGLRDPSYQRIAQRGGVKSMSKSCYPLLRGVTKIKMEEIIRDAVTFSESRRAKTVNLDDMVSAIEQKGSNVAFSSAMKKKIKTCKAFEKTI